MNGSRAVVVEINELPRRVVEDVAAMGRAPFFERLLRSDDLFQTRVDEELPREMYPSQTWASMNIGVEWARHQVWWYNDPKPDDYPLYWQQAARAGVSVGLVGTLHSSPLSIQCADGNYRFVVPDCFAADPDTRPETYRAYQQLNLALTRANSRRSRFRLSPAEVVLAARAMPRLGLKPATLAEVIRLVVGVVAGRVPKERLRTGQFLLSSDLFLRLLSSQRPDLALFFTNHVAAAMHRYWYAMYPGDFDQVHYDERWVEAHRGEIPQAVNQADRFLRQLDQWCRHNQRVLIVVSSMGQGPSRQLDASRTHEAVVVRPEDFVATMELGRPRVLAAMAPNLTLDFSSIRAATEGAARLEELGRGRRSWAVDRVGEVVTLTYDIEVIDPATIGLDGRYRSAAEVGVEVVEVDDHSSGRHTPLGIVGVSNSDSFKRPADGEVSYLDFAPAMLELLGVERLDHHRLPLLQL